MSFKIGLGFDAHRFVEGRDLILGGVPIPHSRGLEGHSDGDALLHALTDALLGAVGAPDIGSLFRPGDDRWKHAPSRLFVETAVKTLADKGYRVRHVDTVIIAEEPKLAVHFESIRSNVAQLLGVSTEDVGVKAKTTEGMGFVGRREGIAAQAIALVSKRVAP
jgi:2-C-methyl-D-erythritol 2,4-cyclodiphosphate synthase